MAPPHILRLRDHVDDEQLAAMSPRMQALTAEAEATMVVDIQGNTVSMSLQPNKAWREIEAAIGWKPPRWAQGRP